MMLSGLLLVIFFVCVAMLWNEGLWGNAIMLINVTTAALIATCYFEPVAVFLNGHLKSFTYFL